MATTGRIVYHGDDETIKKEQRSFSLTDEIMELINSGGGGGAISGVKVNGTIVNPDQSGYVGLTIPGVVNNLSSNSTTDALSAKQGKVLYEYIQALQHVGHFLALWNTATGLPVTNPETSPYNYNTGDYYIVSNVAAAGGTNYKPNGSSYTINVASTTVESGEVQVNDLYFYDGYERRLLDNSGGGGSIAVDSSLSTTSTNPVQNAVITNRLNQMALDANTKTFWLTNLQDTTTGQAIWNWVDGGGNVIVYYGGMPYYMTAKSATRITLYSKFTGTQNSPSNQSTGFTEQLMWIDNNNNTITITNTAVGLGAPYLATNQNYSTVYTPLYDGSPATKKYVDDKFAAVPTYSAGTGISITSNTINNTGVLSVNGSNGAVTVNDIKTGSTAPSNPTEGMLWYDTTNDVLKVYDGTNWNIVGDDTTDINTKAFPISGTTGATALAEAQAAYDWYVAGKTPIIIYGGQAYIQSYSSTPLTALSFVTARLVKTNYSGYSRAEKIGLTIAANNGTVTGINTSSTSFYYIDTNQAYTGSFSPTQSYHPATKKYVDDTVSGAIANVNVKAFFLEDDEDITTATEILERYVEGEEEEEQKYPIIFTGGKTYLPSAGNVSFRGTASMFLRFVNVEPERNVIGYSKTELSQDAIEISGTIDTETFAVSGVTITTETNILGDFLEAKSGGIYITPRTPTYDGDPSTKKYVDDKVKGAISSGTTAPSSPVEGQLRYDTTNDELKVYDGTTWNVTGGGIKLAANSPLTVTEIWAGTESEYNNLSSKGATTAYLCVEE